MIPLVACLVLSVVSQTPGIPLPTLPTTTLTKDGRLGDPVNLVLVGTRTELVAAFQSAGWSVANPITLRSSLRIGASVVRNRPYPEAQVSDLFLFGRVQDVAFELAVGPSPRTRHHVRFWEAGITPDGRPVWVGAGTFDLKVGRSPATGKMTHRISSDVDAERDAIIAALRTGGGLEESHLWSRGGPEVGQNGEGDCYYTDGAVAVGTLRSNSTTLRVCAAPVRMVGRRGR